MAGRLEGKVAVVAGAARGAGRGIAWSLGEEGATVYCTGRSIRTAASGSADSGRTARTAGTAGGPDGPFVLSRRPETIEETAEGVDARGGKGIAVRADHASEADVKASVIRLALGMSEELRPKGVSAVAVTPGFLRSEAMLDYFGVEEANWRDGAALAADPAVATRSGGVFTSWGLAEEYGFTDADGSRPHWGRHLAAHPVEKA